MTPKIAEALRRLKGADWFCAVGQPVTLLEVLPVHSWQEASERCSSPQWDEFANQAGNDLSVIRRKLRPALLPASWNPIIREIKKQIEPLVAARVNPIIEREGISEVCATCVSWDLLKYCEASEISDEYQGSAYLSIGELYLSGHFPCDWIGKYPEGKLAVY